VKKEKIADIRRSKMFSIAALLLASWISVAWADSWDQIKAAAGAIRTIRADFVQEKHLKILSRPLISKGILFYEAPDSLRWEYTAPVRSILLMHKGRIKRYAETSSGLVEDTGRDSKGMQIILQEISMWLQGRFSDNPAFDAKLESGRKIVLTPKGKALSEMIERIELILSDRPGIIKSVTIYEGRDSYTRLRFTNTKINTKIDEARFLEIS